MILAELEIHHSRPVAPTRRVALGHAHLPVDPAPGFGGVLLGGIVAEHVGAIDPDLLPDMVALTNQLEHGQRISQPRLRYRFQADRVGLQRSRHRLEGDGETLRFAFADDGGHAAPHVLGAIYAAGRVPYRARRAVLGAVRQGLGWEGAVGEELIAVLSGFARGSMLNAEALAHPVAWAMGVLGFAEHAEALAEARARSGSGRANGANRPDAGDVQRQYRALLKAAHPDHGGDEVDAARRIADLTEARRILLGS